YFHATVKRRGRRNSILALRVGDRWVESVPEVRAAIVDYFNAHFLERAINRPTLDGIVFQELSPDDVTVLSQAFCIEEIQEGEVVTMFNQFYATSTLSRSFSSYFITLIPKIDVPIGIGDFRPISLVGSLYKVVAKVPAGRLSTVMDKLISPNQ
ncbi:cysteine-rich receptor-like protein kinase, partial [Trifolium medium]|nr:cysteine-rich receptor-like protein kinase [Trifolium medium]